MPSRKKTKPRKPPKPTTPAGGATVACWEDDPGDPKSQPRLRQSRFQCPIRPPSHCHSKLAGQSRRPAFISRGRANSCSMQTLARCAGRPIFGAASCRLVHLGRLATRCRLTWIPCRPERFYSRGDGEDSPGLHFFHDTVKGRVFFSGESPNVACHEMGHAVLDAIRPQLFDAQTIELRLFMSRWATSAQCSPPCR